MCFCMWVHFVFECVYVFSLENIFSTEKRKTNSCFNNETHVLIMVVLWGPKTPSRVLHDIYIFKSIDT